MNQEFHLKAMAVPALFEQLRASGSFMEKGIRAHKALAGIYVLFEDGVAVHVGRTRNLQGRLRGHITKSHYSASFAFKRARRILSKSATYMTKDSRSELSLDKIFKPEFHRQVELVRKMEVRFIEVADTVTQYLLELYAHVEYKLPLDEFDTHKQGIALHPPWTAISNTSSKNLQRKEGCGTRCHGRRVIAAAA